MEMSKEVVAILGGTGEQGLIRQTNREDFEIYEAARSINLRQIRRFSN